MCPSTEVGDGQREFAADVLRNLLHRIDSGNGDTDTDTDRGHYTFLVSHAWTDGAMMYVVYTAPPSDVTWGLVRDTRESNIDPGPWLDVDEAAQFYYLLDFEENWPGRRDNPGARDAIQWSGRLHPGLPEHPSTLSEAQRHLPPTDTLPTARTADPGQTSASEPRRYGNQP